MNTELNLYFYFIKQYFQIFSIWKLRFMNLLDSEKKNLKYKTGFRFWEWARNFLQMLLLYL